MQIYHSIPNPLRLGEWLCYEAEGSRTLLSFPGDLLHGFTNSGLIFSSLHREGNWGPENADVINFKGSQLRSSKSKIRTGIEFVYTNGGVDHDTFF